MSDAQRRQVQAALAKLGYYDATVDGIFGPETRAAIRRWQHERTPNDRPPDRGSRPRSWSAAEGVAMGLKAKFNLVMLSAFVVGLGLVAACSVAAGARHRPPRGAAASGLMMAQGPRIRHYTDTQISPLLAEQNKVRFLPQSIPFYAAQDNSARADEAVPRLPLQRSRAEPDQSGGSATDWEAGIIDRVPAEPDAA